MQSFKKIHRREFLKWLANSELYSKQAVAMVTSFQHKSSTFKV
jgi:hypothetical protein